MGGKKEGHGGVESGREREGKREGWEKEGDEGEREWERGREFFQAGSGGNTR